MGEVVRVDGGREEAWRVVVMLLLFIFLFFLTFTFTEEFQVCCCIAY